MRAAEITHVSQIKILSFRTAFASFCCENFQQWILEHWECKFGKKNNKCVNLGLFDFRSWFCGTKLNVRHFVDVFATSTNWASPDNFSNEKFISGMLNLQPFRLKQQEMLAFDYNFFPKIWSASRRDIKASTNDDNYYDKWDVYSDRKYNNEGSNGDHSITVTIFDWHSCCQLLWVDV